MKKKEGTTRRLSSMEEGQKKCGWQEEVLIAFITDTENLEI